MTDAVTNNRSLVQPLVGGDTNLWGGVLNNGTIAAVDAVLGNNLAVTITSTDVTLTAAQFQNAIFIVSGAITANRNLIIPLSPNSATVACGGPFVVVNNTTGNYTLTVETAASGSTGVTVPQGFVAYLYSDGTNVNYSQNGLPGFALASNGNPNGQLAGTAGSVNTNASLAYDYINNILYVCTTTGTTSTAVWTNPVALSLPVPIPQGYLTPSSTTTIITGDAVAATSIYYTPYQGSWAAINNGSAIIPYRFSQMQLTLSVSQAANNIYDVFLCYNGGTPVIGTGPSWAAGTGGSITAGSCARGTGVGGAAISRDSVSGLWTNTASMSVIYNTGSGNNTITVPAGQGIYLGSIYIDATAGQVSCYRSWGGGNSGGSGGTPRKWGVWNAYNRVPITLQAGDATSEWSYGTATIRPSNGNTANSLTVFSGLAEEVYNLQFTQAIAASSSSERSMVFGIGWNSTTAFSGLAVNVVSESLCAFQAFAKYQAAPALGIQTVTSLEEGQGVGSFDINGTQTNMVLTGTWRG